MFSTTSVRLRQKVNYYLIPSCYYKTQKKSTIRQTSSYAQTGRIRRQQTNTHVSSRCQLKYDQETGVRTNDSTASTQLLLLPLFLPLRSTSRIRFSRSYTQTLHITHFLTNFSKLYTRTFTFLLNIHILLIFANLFSE